jgi:hypothetical protein
MKNQLHSALGFNNGLEVRVLPGYQFFRLNPEFEPLGKFI